MRVLFSRMSITGMVAAALVVGLATGSAQASLVGDVRDLGDIDAGDAVANATHDWHTVFNGTRGEVESTVYFNEAEDVWTYTYASRPQNLIAISEFNLGFEPLAFNGVAGWDFDQAGAAGGSGDSTDFSVAEDADGTLDWEVVADQAWWHGGEITFFYQSTLPPGPEDVLNMINGRAVSSHGITPIPEPASASLLGVLGLAMLRRRRRAKA